MMFTKRINRTLAVLVAGLCLICLLGGCAEQEPTATDPGFVQMVNPLVTVDSIQDMEAKLGYPVPVLNKAVDTYIVLVVNGIAEQGRICYADGSDFNITRGTGDISGIYGGVLDRTETISGIEVSFLAYEDIRYAIWEKDGFAFSLTGGDALANEVATLIGD